MIMIPKSLTVYVHGYLAETESSVVFMNRFGRKISANFRYSYSRFEHSREGPDAIAGSRSVSDGGCFVDAYGKKIGRVVSSPRPSSPTRRRLTR